MVAAFTQAEKNYIADALAARVQYLALHSDVPGGTGINEVSSARVAVSWSAASAGIARPTADLTFTVPASVTVQYVGLWTALTAGTFRGYIPLSQAVVVPAGGARLISLPLATFGISANATLTAV